MTTIKTLMQSLKRKVDRKFAAIFILLVAGYLFLPHLSFYLIEHTNEQRVEEFSSAIEDRSSKISQSIDNLTFSDSKLTQCVEAQVAMYRGIHPLSSGGIDSIKELTRLNCFRYDISSLEGLSQLPLLERLDFQDNKITDIEELGHLKQLKFINLSDNPSIKNITPLLKVTTLKEIVFPDLPDVYCHEIRPIIRGARNNLDNIYCRGKHTGKIQQLISRKSRGGEISQADEKLLVEYRYDKEMTELHKK